MLRKILVREYSALLLVLTLLLFVNLNFAIPRTVNGTGEACLASGYYYDTIQSAINDANNGDTIIVCQNGSGEYLENVVVNRSVNLYGNETYVRVNASDSNQNVFNITANWVNVSNLSISGASGDDKNGIYVTANETTISENEIHNNYVGVYVSNFYNNNIFYTRLFSNIFHDNTGTYGLYIRINSGGPGGYVNVSNNSFSGSRFLVSISADNVNFSNNTVFDGGFAGSGVYLSGTNITSDNNIIYNIQSTGLSFGTCVNCTVSNSQIFNNSQWDFLGCNIALNNVNGTDNKPIVSFNSTVSIDGWDGNFSEIIICNSNNSVIRNSKLNLSRDINGIFLSNTSNSNFSNNTFNNSYSAFYLESGSNNNRFFNNSIYGTYYGFYSSPDSLNISIYQNNISYSYTPAWLYGDNSNVSDNNITASFGVGFGLDLWGNYNSVQDNRITGTTIGLDNSNYDTISGNRIINSATGIYSSGGTSNQIVNNYIENSSVGVSLFSSSSNTLFANNSINGPGFVNDWSYLYGIYVYGVTNITFIGNNISMFNQSNLGYGKAVYISGNSNVHFDSTNILNSSYGIYSIGSNNITLSSILVNGSYYQDFFLSNSGISNLSNFRIVNGSSLGISFFSDESSQILNITNLTFDNPSGTMENYTSISLNDTMLPFTNYNMTWVSNSYSLPLGYNSFNQKFINITSNGSASIDFISWSWADAETVGYDESRLQLWKYNESGWISLNNTPDITNNVLSLTDMVPGSEYGILESPPPYLIVNGSGYPCVYGIGYYATIQSAIDDANDGDTIIVCQNGSGQYTENVNINRSINLYGNETYVRVNASDPTMRVFNITVYGVSISNFTLFDSDTYGLFSNATNLTLSFINSSNQYGGFYIYHPYVDSNISIFNCTSNNSLAEGFVISTNGNSSFLFYNNTAYNNYWGFRFESGSNMNITENFALLNYYGFVFGNLQNSSLTNNTALNSDAYGFWFQYNTEGNNFTENNASYSGVLDLMVSEGSCNNSIENNFGTGGLPINFTNVSVNWENLSASEILLCNADYSNLSNVSISAAGRNGVVLSSTDFTTIRDSNISNSIYGVFLSSSNNNSLYNLSISQTRTPIGLSFSSYNNISGIIFNDETSDLINIYQSNYNLFYNNVLDGPYIQVESSNHNNISHNNISNFSFYGIDLMSTSNISIYENRLFSTNGYGILASRSIDNNFTANTIALSSIWAGPGIYLGDGLRNIISSNNISVPAHDFGIQLLLRNEENQIINNTISNAKYGLFLRLSNNTIISNNTFNSNNMSIFLNYTSVENSIFDNIIENGTVGITLDGENISNNSYYYNSFGNVSLILDITNTTNLTSLGYLNNASNFSFSVDIIEGGVFINETISPAPDPTNFASLGNYLNITNYTFANVSVYFGYTDDELIEQGIPEDRLKLYKHNGTDWIQLNTIVDSVNNIAYSENITSFSVFSLMGEPVSNLVVNGSGYPCTLGREYYSTIQSAVGNASAGDTIVVCQNGSGQYTENVVVDKALNIYGNESNVRVNASNSASSTFSISANYVNISNFNASGATEAANSFNLLSDNIHLYNCSAFGSFNGIYISSTSGNISDNLVYNNSNSGIYVSGSANRNSITNNIIYGTLGFRGYNNTVQNNMVNGSMLNGFYLISASNNTFVNNSAFNHPNSGFYLDPDSIGNNLTNNSAYNTSYGFSVVFSSSTILNNNSAYNNTFGLYLYSAVNTSAFGNIVYNNTYGFYSDSASNNTFLSNLAYNNTYGIYFSSSNDADITNNSIYNSTYGIYLTSSSGTTIENNLVNRSSSDGIYLHSSPNNNLINNTVYNTTIVGILVGNSNSRNNTLVNNSAYQNIGIGISLSGAVNNTLSNNFAYNNGNAGFALSSALNNTLTNNTAYNNVGFGLVSSSGNSLINNTVYTTYSPPSTYGIQLSANSDNNTFSGNSINNTYISLSVTNSRNNTFDNNILSTSSFLNLDVLNSFDLYFVGNSIFSGYYDLPGTPSIWLINANRSNMTNTHVYNDSIQITSSSGEQIIKFTNLTLDRSEGDFSNYTSVSIYDSVSNGESYLLNWSTNSTSLPSGRVSFNRKFINISTVSGSPSIDQINWTWLDSETAGYNESNLELIKYDGSSWLLLNNSPDTTGNLLSTSNMVPASIYALVENTAPLALSIQSPENITYNTSTIELNYTVSSQDSCWYSNDSGVTNATLASCNNASISGYSEGSHTITVYSNDSLNTISSESVSFTTDLTAPNVSIISPSSGYSTTVGNSISISVNVTDSTSAISNVTANISKDGAYYSTVTLTYSSGLYGASFSSSTVGTYNLTIIANDSANNINSSESVLFTLTQTTTITDPPPKEYIGWSSSTLCPDNKIKITTEPNTRISLFYRPTIASLSATANSEGIALFNPVGEGTYDITLSKEGFKTTNGDLSHTTCPPPLKQMSVSSEKICPENQIAFTVFETETTSPLVGALVSFNLNSKSTNTDGQAVFSFAESGSYPISVTKEGYSAYSTTDSFERCPLRTMDFTWRVVCLSRQVVLLVFDSETQTPISGALVGDFGTTRSNGELALPQDVQATTFGMSKDGYQDIPVQEHAFRYSCEGTNETLENGTNANITITPSGGDSGNKPNKSINQTNQTNITIPFTPGFPSSGNAVEKFVSDIDFFKKTVVDYISETEEKKNIAATISIVVLLLILLLVYLRFIAKKI